MREAMETALQDRAAAPAELTVTWEEVCRYLDSLVARAAGGRRSRSTAPSWRRFTTFFRRTSGWCRHTGALARRLLAGRLLARYS